MGAHDVADFTMFGAKGDARTFTDGAMTSGSNILTTGAGITGGDVGKLVAIRGAGAAAVPLVSTIVGIDAATGMPTLAVAASTTVSGAIFVYGTDDYRALQTAFDSVGNDPGGLVLGTQGNFLTSQTLVADGRRFIQGVGRADSSANGATTTGILRGTTIVAAGPLDPVVHLGPSGGVPNRHNSMKDVAIACLGMALRGVKMSSVANQIERVSVDRATTVGVENVGGSFNDVLNCRIFNDYAGKCLVVNGVDARHVGNVFGHASSTGPQVEVLAANAAFVGANHFSAGSQTSSQIGGYLTFDPTVSTGFLRVVGNRFDKTDSNHIVIAPASGITASHIAIHGNAFFITTETTDNTASAIHLDTSASTSKIHAASIMGNIAGGQANAQRFRTFLRRTTVASQTGVSVMGNTLKFGVAFMDSPDGAMGPGNRLWNNATSLFADPSFVWTTQNAAPADADVTAGELFLWFDSTNGAAKLMIKSKQADGTVRTGSVALA